MKKKYRSKIVITVSGQEHKVADRDDDSCTLIVTGVRTFLILYINK